MNGQSLPQHQKPFVVWKNQQVSGIMSPIERWADENYTPQPLDFIWRSTTTSVQIIARLNEVDPQYFQVDLARAHVILLLAPPTDAGSPVQEYYSEVPLPPSVKQNVIRVDFAGDFAIISLERKPESLLQRVKTEIARLNHDLALISGKRGRLDIFNSLDA